MKTKKKPLRSPAVLLLSLALFSPPAAAQTSYFSDAVLRGSAPAADGSLFELPLIGRIDSAGLRIAETRTNFSELVQESLVIGFATRSAWQTAFGTTTQLRLSLNAGRFVERGDDRAFASFGPVLRVTNPAFGYRAYVDIGLSPTVIDGTQYDDMKLGTSFNFTSHIALGIELGERRQHALKLRYQHISNGGLDEVNPGVNMIGVDYVFRLGER